MTPPPRWQRPLRSWLTWPTSSLRRVFTLPVLVQITAAVGLVGYLSFENGQKAVSDLATQLRSEISARIEQELRSYFRGPHDINRLNASAFRQGDLDIVSAQRGEHLIFQQMKVYPTIAFIYCGSIRSGEFFGVLRSPDTGELQLSYGNAGNDFLREYYSLDVRGNRTYRIRQAEQSYDARTRPWFDAALAANRPTWTDVYLAFTTGLPNVTASLPVYGANGKQVLGVCGTDVVLPEEFRSFLAELDIGQTGQAFVIDRQGQLISSSTDEPLLIQGSSEEPLFLKALGSRNPLVRESVQVLHQQFGQLNSIREVRQLAFQLEGQRHFLEVLPFEDGFGLDWLIVVVVPESDFMGQIIQNTQATVLLCVLALAVALLIGILSTRWVTAPILQLNTAVKDIAEGSWDRRVQLQRRDEVGQLGEAVNRMAAQLSQAFVSQEQQKNAFARFFPPEYLRLLQKPSVTAIELGDHVSKEMTVMFSDIRGFTSRAEKMAPQEIFDFINAYLGRISPAIRAHGGFVVKYLGDGIMAVFPEHPADAIASAISQLQRVRTYNQERQQQGFQALEVGISLHTGHLMMGMIGERDRIQGDALSDSVNLAARLEGLTKIYGVSLMISQTVQERLPADHGYRLRFLDRVIVQGRSEPIDIYDVLDAEDDPTCALKRQTLADFALGIQAYGRSASSTDASPCLHQAQEHFARVVALHPGDRAAHLYLERIALLLRELPPNWNGIWSFQRKG